VVRAWEIGRSVRLFHLALVLGRLRLGGQVVIVAGGRVAVDHSDCHAGAHGHR